MDLRNDSQNISRREVIKLAGTAAAFCASFGFLHGSQVGGVVQDKHLKMDKVLQAKWQQAEIKWYRGGELLHSSAVPAVVLKHLQSDISATVELKFFRTGKLLRSLGTIAAKH